MTDLQTKIEDAEVEGWELEERQGDRAVMIRRRTGSLVAHIILFIFVGWWTLGLANIVYFLYKYFVQKDKKVIRADGSEPVE